MLFVINFKESARNWIFLQFKLFSKLRIIKLNNKKLLSYNNFEENAKSVVDKLSSKLSIMDNSN